MSKVSVDEVFMHYFQNMSSASGDFARASLLDHTNFPILRKNPAGAHARNR